MTSHNLPPEEAASETVIPEEGTPEVVIPEGAIPEDTISGGIAQTVAEALQEGSAPPPPPKKKRRWPKVLLALLIFVVLLCAGLVVAHEIYVQPPEIPVTSLDAEEETGEEAEEEEDDAPETEGTNRKDGVYTFLLIGRDDGGGGNTDTIMVGCFDTVNGTLDVLSIYRDTLVDVPWEVAKINSVYNVQGIEGVQKQIKNLIGYAPDFYFVVELDAVAELVDAIGGVDYDIPYTMNYDDASQNLHIHYSAGLQHLDGADAVKVLRWRKNNSGLSVGDVGRVEIQHSFLKALASQLFSLGNVTKLGTMLDIMDRNLESNLTYGEMLWFAERVLTMDQSNIRFHNLPGDYTGALWSETYQSYLSYVFVNSSALLELVNEYMNPYLTDITADMQNVVHSTTVNNLPVEEESDSG